MGLEAQKNRTNVIRYTVFGMMERENDGILD
jgi:hypothetical protein